MDLVKISYVNDLLSNKKQIQSQPFSTIDRALSIYHSQLIFHSTFLPKRQSTLAN